MRRLLTTAAAGLLAALLNVPGEARVQLQGYYCFIVPITGAVTKQQVKTSLDGVDAMLEPREENGLPRNHPEYWARYWVLAGTEQTVFVITAVNGDARANAADLLDRVRTSAYRGGMSFTDVKAYDDLLWLVTRNAYWNEGCTHQWLLTPGVDPSLVPDPAALFVPFIP